VWPEIFEFLSTIVAVACCAAAVKLADDYLDKEYDAIAGKTNWAEIFDKGTMLYAMFLLALSAGINAPLALSLFLGSYIVGMFSAMRDKFPSRLNGFQESLVAVTVGLVLFGWNTMLFSVSFVFAIQLFDDYIDAHSDCLSGQRNLANRYGKMECLLVGLFCTLAAFWLNERLFVPTLAGTAIVYLLSFRFTNTVRI
jgi:4-hydroxybenzoate polyprenyltransferase